MISSRPGWDKQEEQARKSMQATSRGHVGTYSTANVVVQNGVEACPGVELSLPVRQGGQGRDDLREVKRDSKQC